ncbi:hypothetical protein CROQUDRAFT_87488 [Cronartium quercuum f. sp. fusiforme G11]|uniref:Uncharacterized protein n=1 Tax=Cronartium quercuum f. sp. fusiforme G11 TaxID=708437 RepID=A0A9P6THD8_9BASI|nr:hypothetical protein CROQUDRAFT_87488 [Cronartium quercuum f. sp. fusiforme G11]
MRPILQQEMEGLPPNITPVTPREEDVCMDALNATQNEPHSERLRACSSNPAVAQVRNQPPPATPINMALNSPNPFSPESDSNRVQVKGLVNFEEKCLNKKCTHLGGARLDEEDILGTPHSKRFINLFPECTGNLSTSNAIQKLHLLVESTLPLPRGGGGTIQVESDTAANIRILMARVLEMDPH